MIDPTPSQAPWTSHLEAMDTAITTNNASGAVLAWRHAYAAALDQPGWRGLVDVAGAALRIGAIPGFRKAAESRARESYWTALFRARRQGSLNGVLDAAGRFGTLGDRCVVEQCIRIAERLTPAHGGRRQPRAGANPGRRPCPALVEVERPGPRWRRAGAEPGARRPPAQYRPLGRAGAPSQRARVVGLLGLARGIDRHPPPAPHAGIVERAALRTGGVIPPNSSWCTSRSVQHWRSSLAQPAAASVCHHHHDPASSYALRRIVSGVRSEGNLRWATTGRTTSGPGSFRCVRGCWPSSRACWYC